MHAARAPSLPPRCARTARRAKEKVAETVRPKEGLLRGLQTTVTTTSLSCAFTSSCRYRAPKFKFTAPRTRSERKERCGRCSDSSAAALVNSLARERASAHTWLPSSSAHEPTRACSGSPRKRAAEFAFRQSCRPRRVLFRATPPCKESLAKQCRQEATERRICASRLAVSLYRTRPSSQPRAVQAKSQWSPRRGFSVTNRGHHRKKEQTQPHS